MCIRDSKRDVHHFQRDLSSRVLTAVAEQAINPQTSILSVEIPSSCSGAGIEIGAGGHVLSLGEINCNGSSFGVSTSGQVYEKK